MPPQVVRLRTWSKSRLEGIFDADEVRALERYSSKTLRNQEIISLAHRCMRGNAHPFIHPLSGKRVACHDSLSHDEVYHMLGFTDGSESVYVIQRVSSIEAFYFPDRDLVLSFRLAPHFFDKLFEKVDLSDRDLSGQREFAGFIASHHRPYHYFYDILPAMWEIDSEWTGEGEIRRTLEMVQLQGGDYLPANVLFPEYICYTASSQASNYYTEMRGKYHLKVGYAGLRDEDQEGNIKKFDRLLRHSRFVRPRENLSLAERKTTTIAFDISNEKGTWKSIEEDIPKIIEVVTGTSDTSVHVLFDGWTLPHTPSPRDLRRVKEERRLAQAIEGRLAGAVDQVTHLVGAHPRDKIELLAGVDAFVSRYGTGSMFASRILRRPGVVHHSGLANYEDVHIQGDEVVPIVGKPVNASKDVKAHSVSYDVDWRDVAAALQSLLPK